MYQQVIDQITGAATCIKRLSDNAFIPMDEANTDYQAYLKWLDEGNEPLPPDGASVAEPAAEPLPPDEVPE